MVRGRPIDTLAAAGQRDRSIHGPSIQESKAESLGELAGSAAFSRPGGTVDGDYHGVNNRIRWARNIEMTDSRRPSDMARCLLFGG